MSRWSGARLITSPSESIVFSDHTRKQRFQKASFSNRSFILFFQEPLVLRYLHVTRLYHPDLCTEHCSCMIHYSVFLLRLRTCGLFLHRSIRPSYSPYGELSQWCIASSGCTSTSWLSHQIFTANLREKSVKSSPSISHRTMVVKLYVVY